METTDFLKQGDQIRNLAALAAQYGPGFFAIMFTLFIPMIGHRWFTAIIQTKLTGSDEERSATIQVYKFYWISGIVTGLLLTVLSVSWWVYVQTAYTLPQSEDSFNRKVSQEVSREVSGRIFEGTIAGVNDGDVLVYNDTHQGYRIYFYPLRNEWPFRVKFVVIFDDDPKPASVIRFIYMAKKDFDEIRRTDEARQPIPLQFCLTKDASNLELVRDDSGLHTHLSFDITKCGKLPS